jgi:hypothetical protein
MVYSYYMSVKHGRWGAHCIRFLALILALTASRSNFPLLAPQTLSSGPHQEALQVRNSKSWKQSEGVKPSSRHVESRPGDWIKDCTSPGPSVPLAADPPLHESELRSSPVYGTLEKKGTSTLTLPQYLRPHLAAHALSCLAPPA